MLPDPRPKIALQDGLDLGIVGGQRHGPVDSQALVFLRRPINMGEGQFHTPVQDPPGQKRQSQIAGRIKIVGEEHIQRLLLFAPGPKGLRVANQQDRRRRRLKHAFRCASDQPAIHVPFPERAHDEQVGFRFDGVTDQGLIRNAGQHPFADFRVVLWHGLDHATKGCLGLRSPVCLDRFGQRVRGRDIDRVHHREFTFESPGHRRSGVDHVSGFGGEIGCADDFHGMSTGMAIEDGCPPRSRNGTLIFLEAWQSPSETGRRPEIEKLQRFLRSLKFARLDAVLSTWAYSAPTHL